MVENLGEPGWGKKPNGGYGLRMGEIKPSGRHDTFNTNILKQFVCCCYPLKIITKKTKTLIITKMNAYGYTVIFMFGILNNRNQYL